MLVQNTLKCILGIKGSLQIQPSLLAPCCQAFEAEMSAVGGERGAGAQENRGQEGHGRCE